MKKGDQEGQEKIRVKIKGKFIPQYQSKQAAGCDLCACINREIVIEPGHFSTVPTGISLEIPDGYEAQVRPRSGLAMKHGIGILNGPGTIDADYRGEVRVIIFNYGKNKFCINNGDRIAQLVFARVARVEFKPVNELDETERGSGGFGHSGR